MTVAAATLAGVLAGRLVWLLMRPVFTGPVFTRSNWRGRQVPTGAGVTIVVAVLVVEAARAAAAAAGVADSVSTAEARAATVLAAAGFGLLGLLDDLAGSDEARGFRGHLSALARGRLTTGGVKIIGGTAIAAIVVLPAAGGSLLRLLLDAALVALAANLGNLFDRAPGRVVKVSALAFAALVAGARAAPVLSSVGVVVGAGLALAVDDLRERMMLGDAGANVLGAAIGLGVVLACAPATRNAALAGVVALNVASEVVSFSRVIAAVPPLRAVDRAGRLQ